MPNWKKVILSGSDATLNNLTVTGTLTAADLQGDTDWKIFSTHITSSKDVLITGSLLTNGEIFVEGNITASNTISASGHLFASLSFDDTPVTDGVVVYDTANGQLYFTGSYGGGSVVGGADSDWGQGGAQLGQVNPNDPPAGGAFHQGDNSGFVRGSITSSQQVIVRHNSLVALSQSLCGQWGLNNSVKNSLVGFQGVSFDTTAGINTDTYNLPGFGVKEVNTYVTAVHQEGAGPNRRIFPVCLTGKLGGSQGFPGGASAGGFGLNDGYPYNNLRFHQGYHYTPDAGGGGGGGNGGDGGPDHPGGDSGNPGTPDDDFPGGVLHIQGALRATLGTHDLTQGSASFGIPTGSNQGPPAVEVRPQAGILFFETGSTLSPSGSYRLASASAILSFETSSKSVQLFVGSKESNDLTRVMFISHSGDNPRIGFGTTNPKTVFDFRDAGDTTTGAELLIRSARSTQGALTGDEGGSINFAIDSGSFNDIKTSGSLAKIKTNVNSVGNTGVQGKLVFELSKGTSDSQDAFSYGFSQISDTDFGLFSQIQTASLLLRDFSAGGKSVIEMRDNSDNTKLKLANGNITASGDISSSGIITANSFIGALTGTATGLSGTPDITVGTIEATSLNVTSITSSIVTSSIIQTEGSNIFGDGISDTQTFNGHITASGNISASGNIMGLNLSGTNTGDQDLSSYIQASQTGSFLTASNTGSLATIAQLNASSSALQTNIDASIQPSQTGSFIVASQTGSFLTSIPGGTLSSSAQIAPNISGAFTADSASFSTRVTANETITTKTLISGSSQVSFNSISGLPSGLLSSSDNFVINSSTASFAVTSSNVLFNQITSSGAVNIQGILSIPGFLNVSSSLAAAVAGGDNLGNHTATQDLNLNSNTIKGVANITASGNISASGQIIAEAGPTINITLASDTATNIDTFNTSSNNGAIYDYTLFSTPSGARAGQCMVIHHNGNTDFTDTSTPTLGSETSIPFFETSVNGSNVEVKITSGSGYTFKAFIKKL